MRIERGLAALPYERLRAMVGSGARGMVGVGFGLAPDDAGYLDLRDEFLRRYEAAHDAARPASSSTCRRCWRVSPRQGIAWGIVTNKATRFAAPLVAALGLAESAGTLVCGDTTAHSKPHPEPLLEAARRLDVPPAALRLCRRRPARRRCRPGGGDAHHRRRLGLSRRRRPAGSLGGRRHHRRPRRAPGALPERRLISGPCPKLGVWG